MTMIQYSNDTVIYCVPAIASTDNAYAKPDTLNPGNLPADMASGTMHLVVLQQTFIVVIWLVFGAVV